VLETIARMTGAMTSSFDLREGGKLQVGRQVHCAY
jgi:hypothetical protein